LLENPFIHIYYSVLKHTPPHIKTPTPLSIPYKLSFVNASAKKLGIDPEQSRRVNTRHTAAILTRDYLGKFEYRQKHAYYYSTYYDPQKSYYQRFNKAGEAAYSGVNLFIIKVGYL
jgi:hypothetical protein